MTTGLRNSHPVPLSEGVSIPGLKCPELPFGIKLEVMLGMNFYPCLAFPFSTPSLVCTEHHLYTTWTKVISKPTSGKYNPRYLLILKPFSQGRDAQTGPPKLRAINHSSMLDLSARWHCSRIPPRPIKTGKTLEFLAPGPKHRQSMQCFLWDVQQSQYPSNSASPECSCRRFCYQGFNCYSSILVKAVTSSDTL